MSLSGSCRPRAPLRQALSEMSSGSKGATVCCNAREFVATFPHTPKTKVAISAFRYASSAWENAYQSLLFVRCGVSYRNAVAIPLPSLGVSSLDLGRLHCERPFFLTRLWGRGTVHRRRPRVIRRPHDRAAVPPAEYRRGSSPVFQYLRTIVQSRRCARGDARPCKARG